MTVIETPLDAEAWLPLYHSAVEYGRGIGRAEGDRDGHKRGWYQAADIFWTKGFEAGVESARASDLEFARMVEQEYHRRELQGERTRDLVHQLIESARTAENRRKWAQRFNGRRDAA